MDADNEQQLHPNWRALATVHLPLKRFIRANYNEVNNDRIDEKCQKYEIKKVCGDEIQKFYEAIINDPSAKKIKNFKYGKSKVTYEKIKPIHSIKLLPFDATKLFGYATENKANELNSMDFKNDAINTKDGFGWTALMMAACEGASEAVQALLALGADKYVKDRKGNTALDLARRNGHLNVVRILENVELMSKLPSASESETKYRKKMASKPFYCDLCQQTFKETTKLAHITSTLHQFNTKSDLSTNKLLKFNIPPKNRGLQLMVKQGWDRESGLGPNHNGRLYPVKTVIRKERTGLGIEQQPARVTHFEAYDLRATQRNKCDYYRKKPRNGNDIRQEKIRDWKQERRLRRELS